jgi:hypothetical protein
MDRSSILRASTKTYKRHLLGFTSSDGAFIFYTGMGCLSRIQFVYTYMI